jgi:hypothetical protein
MFLDSIRERQEEEERKRKEHDGVEVKNFKEAVAARTSAVNNPPPELSSLVNPSSKPKAPVKPVVVKKDTKKSLKGVLVKKRPKAPVKETSEESKKPEAEKSEKGDDDSERDTKRQKLSS